MKKLINLFPVALGLAALTGCNNDDFQDLAGNKMDLSNKYVLKANVEGANDKVNTRAYWDATSKSTNLTFGEDDILRVYDSDLRIYDNFQSNGQLFVTDADKANITKKNSDGNLDYAYALHAEPGCISYAGWNNGSNIALLKIDAVDYSETVAKDGETVVYKHAIPMWGKVTSTVSDVQTGENAEASFTTDLKWLTPRASVVFNYGIGANIKAVRARSMKLNEGITKENTKLQKLIDRKVTTVEAAETDLKDGENDVIVENLDAPLSGWFEAVLEEDNPRPLRKVTMGGVSPEYSAEVVVNVNITDEDSYTNVVYLPITLLDETDYQYLLFEYQTTDEKWHFIRLADYGNMIERGFGRTSYITGMEITAEMTCDLTKLSDINDFLGKLKIDKDMVISFPNQVASYIYDAGSSFENGIVDDKLVIPASMAGHKITLNFNGGASETPAKTSLITSGPNLKNDNTPVPGKETKPVPVQIYNKGNANVVINVASVAEQRPVTAVVVENKGTVTLGKNVATITANEGDIVVDATYTPETTEVTVVTDPATEEAVAGGTAAAKIHTSVSVIGGKVKAVTHNGAGKVTIENATVTTLTNNGSDIKANNGIVTTLVNNGSGNITFVGGGVQYLTNGAEGGEISLTEMAGVQNGSLFTNNSSSDLTISRVEGSNYNVYTLVSNGGGDINIDGLTIGNSLTINDKDGVTTKKVIVNDLNLKKLVYNTDRETGALEFISEGNSTIKEVEVNGESYANKQKLIKFTSKWDGESKASKVTTENKFGACEIFTAAELAALQDKVGYNNVNIYADIDLDLKLWTGIHFLNNVTLNGNGHNIEKVSVGNTAATATHRDKGLRYGFGFINCADYSLTVKDLTLDGVDTKNLMMWTELEVPVDNSGQQQDQISGIGGLVGELKGAGTFENVKVKATTLGFTGDVEAFDGHNTQSCKVGGLVGMLMTSGNLTIKDCEVNVTEKIIGQWGLGGLVGDARTAPGAITLTDNAVSVKKFESTLQLANLKEGDYATSENYGRIGMLIGCVVDYDWQNMTPTLTISQKDMTQIKDVIVNNRSELGFAHNIRTVGSKLEKFVGYAYEGVLLVGYSGTAANPKTGAFSLTVNGEKVEDAPKTIDDLNVFEKTGISGIKKR